MFYDAAAVDRLLPYDVLISALKVGLTDPCTTPVRGNHKLDPSGNQLLVMPAWQAEKASGVKLLTVFPQNPTQGKATIQGVFVLFSGIDGSPRAVLDGTRLTQRRTAALCSLATALLAPHDADSLLVIGTGALAPQVIRAHAAERSWTKITLWGRNSAAAEAIAADCTRDGLPVSVTTDLETAVRSHSVLSAATSSREPLLKDAWIAPGCHVNLLGAYTEDMHEAEPELIARATLFVDDRESVLTESGEVIAALRRALITEDHIQADIQALVSSPLRPRPAGEVTLFKSVGFGALDLVAAECLATQAGH